MRSRPSLATAMPTSTPSARGSARRDVFEIFETELGIELAEAHLEIEAVRGTRALSQALGTKANDPILKVNRLTSTTAGVAIDCEHLYYRAEPVQVQGGRQGLRVSTDWARPR
ncbi:hypothetical protein BH09PSE5_BH09PSE5_09210 [soil metagenome]